jgi:DNA-binding beta-propeller fold protein YncE
MLPQLRDLFSRFYPELVVISISSPKFNWEKHSQAVRNAVLQHRLRHPVVSDPGHLLWNAYGIRAWPSLVIVGPNSEHIGTYEGEVSYQDLFHQITHLLEYFRSQSKINKNPIDLKPLEPPKRELSYPAGVRYIDELGLIVISDTGNNRLLLVDKQGQVLQQIGSGKEGFADGPISKASFNQPRGVTYSKGLLFVADTANHSVRKVELDKGVVTTIAGDGKRGFPVYNSYTDIVSLASPWDLDALQDRVFIAMAGMHQIWLLNQSTGNCAPFAGSGYEGIRDGPKETAWLAQTSGIRVFKNFLYFIDSETSSVRQLDLSTNIVSTIVGQGLFDFGDTDGNFITARLQHPLGIEVSNDGNHIFIADSYNHKIKLLDLHSKSVSTIAGSGIVGYTDGDCEAAMFAEPSYIDLIDDKTLLVADTNNSAIRSIDLQSCRVTTFL